MIAKWMNLKHAAGWLLSLHFLFWTGVAFTLDIHPDMADHWVWSRYLDWGYYEHPPMVAWMMRLITATVPAHPTVTLKLGSVAISTLILWLAYRVALSFFSRKTALLYILLLEAAPYFSIGSIFWHIDQPYMIFWLCGLLVLSKFVDSKNRQWILLFGVVAGLGAVSKYIMVLFYVGLAFWCFFDRRFRYLLTCWQSYCAGLISLLLFLPVILWNAQRDWISFRFQLGRGLSGMSHFGNLPELTIGHLLIFSPIFTLLVWALLFSKKLVVRPVSEKQSLLLATGLLPFLFFSFSSLRGTIADPHWLNVCYFSMFLLLAHRMDKAQTVSPSNSSYGIGFALAFGYNAILLAVALLQVHYSLLPIPKEYDLSKKLIGWQRTAEQIEEVLAKEGIARLDYVVTREYQLGGALALYLKSMPLSHSIEKPERNSWSPVERVKRFRYALFCPPPECDGTKRKAEKRLQKRFELLKTVKTAINGNPVRELSVYLPQP